MAKKRQKKTKSSKIESVKQKATSVNFKNLNYQKFIVPGIILVLLIISMSYSYSVRNDPATLEVTNSWAANSINQQLSQQANAIVSQQYPNLPQQQRAGLVAEQVKNLRSQIGEQYDQQVELGGAGFRQRLQREMRDGRQQTYLLAIDPYFHLWRTENYLEHGHTGDSLKDGKPWLDLMWAPIGAPAITEFHNVFATIWHRIYSIFNPGSELMQSFFWLPVITSMLAVIPAFFIVYRKTNMTGGFVAAMITAIHPYFVTRTAAGFSDTDPYQVLFPLLITWLVIESLIAKKFKNQLILSGIAGVAVALFAWAWVGWWYVFDFALLAMAGTLWFKTTERTINKNWIWYKKLGYLAGAIILFPVVIGYFFYDLYKDYKKKIKLQENPLFKGLASIITFFISSWIFVSIFVSSKQFFTFIKSPFGFTTIQNAAHSSLWPNVFTTVAELNTAGIGTIVNNIGFNIAGGLLFFFLALLGIGFSFPGKKFYAKDWIIIGTTVVISALVLQNLNNKLLFFGLIALPVVTALYFALHRKLNIVYPLIITVWFLGTIYAATQGVRFIILLVPAFAVAAGITMGRISQIIENYLFTEYNWNKYVKLGVSIGLLVIISVVVLSKPIQAGQAVGRNEVPSFDDAWYDSLKAIEADSQPNAIINSWWDFGHWFKAIAHRPVTFDGASQNSPQAHWIGRVLSTPDEREALGILRMLDCGAHQGEIAILNNLKDPLSSIKLTKEIILIDKKSDAKKVLLNAGINNSEADRILELTHCVPPENYFITSGDMVGKSGVWSHFGNWDFEKAFIYNELKTKTPGQVSEIAQKKLGYSKTDADAIVFQANGLDERQANNWIGPFAGYFGNQVFGCTQAEGSELHTCTLGLGIGQDARGSSNVIERVFFDPTNPDNVTAQVGVYDASRQRLGGSNVKPGAIVYTGKENLERIEFSGETLPVDIIIDTEANRALLANKEVSLGTMTKLFFLDGIFMDHFEQISDKTSVFGNRIRVWKVNWPEEFMKE